MSLEIKYLFILIQIVEYSCLAGKQMWDINLIYLTPDV